MLHGKNFIGRTKSARSKKTFQAFAPNDNQNFGENFHVASPAEVRDALAKAATAFTIYKKIPIQQKATFLEAIGQELVNLGDRLIDRACKETALPVGRITGERGRTVNQLNMFAQLVREGSWVDASIDLAQPDRLPMPKVDIRRMLIPVGPVVVFGASNFPLAFSTAGGDTASALAAGCPVIVKAHPAHPGTSELVAEAILKASIDCGIPDGVFSLLHDHEYGVARKLVKSKEVKSVAFTGSLGGGKAIYDLAQKRPDPIPVFAEMGSVNPVIFLPGIMAEKPKELAEQYAGSINAGVGQFCTNPGLMLTVDGRGLSDFDERLQTTINQMAAGTMLHPSVKSGYEKGVERTNAVKGVKILASGQQAEGMQAVSQVVAVDVDRFKEEPALHEEVFGPSSLQIKCRQIEDISRVIDDLEGQLTITIMGNDEDLVKFAPEIDALREKCGRLIMNGVPTGVEVCHSMHHGGPYPATTDARFTSVGTGAIKRFARPIAFQNCPNHSLPAELQGENPLKIWRHTDGVFSK